MLKPLDVPRFDGALGEYVDADWNLAERCFDVATIARPHRVALLRVAGETLAEIAHLAIDRWGLYLRHAVDGGGRSAIVLQDGRDIPPGRPGFPAVVLVFDGRHLREVPCPEIAVGQNCVEVVGVTVGWRVWIQTSPETVWRATLTLDGRWVDQQVFSVRELTEHFQVTTSQGFAQGYPDGRVRLLDQWRAAYAGLACPNEDLGIVVGQNADDGPDRLRARHDGGPIFVPYRGTAHEPHVVAGGGRWLLTARTPAGPAVVLMAPPFQPEIVEPPAPPPTQPPPKPDPKPEEPTVQIPDHLHLVREVSDAHPHLLEQNTRETMTELLWRVAVALHAHDPLWGLLSKSASENHTVIAGQQVAVDALAYGTSNEIVDIFRAAWDGPGTGGLTWNVDERRPSNVRVTPPPFPGQEPKPDPEPEPKPPVPNPPTTPNPPPAPPPVTDDRTVKALERIAAALEELARRPVPVGGGSIDADVLVDAVINTIGDRLIRTGKL